MRVVVASSAKAASRIVAQILARTLKSQPDCVLGLPTGRTMIPVYETLVRLHRRGLASFRRATTFNLDEFLGLPAGHPGSYRAFMSRHLFDHVDLGASASHFPERDDGRGGYDEHMRRAGGLDLCLVGIGRNGHVGFNEPARRLHARTHRVRLLSSSRHANAYLFSGHVRNVPRFAMSMGIGTILQARAIVLLATGRDKARVVRSAFSGKVTTSVPASLLQAHPNVLVVLDRAAARAWRAR